MSTSICFILNTASNKTKAEIIFKNRLEQIKSAFPKADFIYIREGDSIADIANKAAQSYQFLIACGGDGTANRVAKGILGTQAAMGVLPLGSGNDFARNIGMTRNFERNLEILQQKKVARIDTLQFGNNMCINTLGFGLDGLTNYYASKSKIKKGAWRYFWNGLKALFLARPFIVEMTIDRGESFQQKVWMVTVANGKTEGGKYTISPESDNKDGIVEVILVKPIPRLKLIFEFVKLSFGKSFDPEVVQFFSAEQQISIKIPEYIKGHFDGEKVLELQPYNIHVKTQSLAIITPQ